MCSGWDRRSSVGMLLRVIGVRYAVSVRQAIRRDREDAINTSDETRYGSTLYSISHNVT